VQMLSPCGLAGAVNIAIDEGLWYLHITEERFTSGTTLGSVGSVNVGGWDQSTGSPGCISANGGVFSCDNQNNSGVINADNIQAYEVNGHVANGPASDPYTDDVARGLNRMFMFLSAHPVAAINYTFNAPPACPAAPCTITYDGNSNGQMILGDQDNLTRAGYETGQYLDAIVASANPTAVTTTGPSGVAGLTYKNIAQDLEDAGGYCQYPNTPGGGWWYFCPNQGGTFDDNSASQWDAIGLIGAARAFGLTAYVPTAPPIGLIQSANLVWVVNSEASNGSFGYQSTSPVWGPFATTPSGMVQMALDQVGRGDTRWDNAETFMRDNFCNNPNAFPGNPFANAESAPLAYTYGMFSFTKAMLLHDPGGVLTPITMLQSQTSGVNPIDWYGAQASAGAPCDGIAQSLVSRQGLNGDYPPTPAVPTNGWWYGHSTVSNHYPFETAWSIIMLRRTVFVACVNNLYGRGIASGIGPTRVDLTWTGIANVDHYAVMRGTTSGGPYVQVGSAPGTSRAFKDINGLANGSTYYYVLQPINSAGGEICQSNEAKVVIPKPH